MPTQEDVLKRDLMQLLLMSQGRDRIHDYHEQIFCSLLFQSLVMGTDTIVVEEVGLRPTREGKEVPGLAIMMQISLISTVLKALLPDPPICRLMRQHEAMGNCYLVNLPDSIRSALQRYEARRVDLLKAGPPTGDFTDKLISALKEECE